MIDLHADAKAVHVAKINSVINITALDLIDAHDVSLSAAERILPANARKFFGSWDKDQTDRYAKHCLQVAVTELAERAEIAESVRNVFRMGFFGREKEAEHAIEYGNVDGEMTEEDARAAFEAGKHAAGVYQDPNPF